jgi:hemerythrin-like domain-containing protein
MSDVVALARPDTSDMVRVHRVFREGFAVAPQLLGAARAEDSAQIQRIATYYDALVLFLHVHHEGEDELLWPRLLDRCPARAATVEHAAGQHQGVLGDLAVSEARLAEWKAEPTPDRAASLAAALATLGANLAVHLDDEERNILPLAAEHLTVEEWAELPTHGMQTGGQRAPHLMWLVLGLIREQMSAEQRAHMDSVMPPPVLELWTTQGEPMFREFITELRH